MANVTYTDAGRQNGVIGLDVRLNMSGIALWAHNMPPKLRQAIAYGLNNGGRVVFRQVRKGLKEQTGVKKYSSITSRTETISAKPSTDAVFRIVVRGKPIPIKEFPVRVTGKGVSASPWGTARVFERSFRSKNTGLLLARRDKARGSIRPLLGPNLAKELLGLTRGNQHIPELFQRASVAEVKPRIIQALEKAMSK